MGRRRQDPPANPHRTLDLLAGGGTTGMDCRRLPAAKEMGRPSIVTGARAIELEIRGNVSGIALQFRRVEPHCHSLFQDLLVRLVKERIPKRFGLDHKTDIQVLTPMNRSLLGARNLNQVLQEVLNPSTGGPEIQRFGWTFRIGDRVIQTENDYNRDVFNGDLGVIEKIDRIEQEMVVNFEGRQVEYDFGDLDELSLADVLSIHKSQGSEFPCVVVPLHTQHYMMLRRSLLYTAVTRGKKLVVLIGTKKALGMAVRRQDTGQRHTALKKRLQEA
jgi:exodeoxyribonuclease V alpha subunit